MAWSGLTVVILVDSIVAGCVWFSLASADTKCGWNTVLLTLGVTTELVVVVVFGKGESFTSDAGRRDEEVTWMPDGGPSGV